MARGWESKAVEAQQDAARADRRGPHEVRAPVPHARERATLELARARAEADLERATHEAHRRVLEATIAALDDRLARLDA